ncbi:MAG TPA: hypothetical protein PL045_05890 [Chitinophagaceae bacterium]|nr:hypothetical protein [Chitinophagaceae bacterium]
MQLKKLIAYTVPALFLFAACSKSSTSPSNFAVVSSSEDESVQGAGRNLKLLTGQTWKYSKYLINFVDSSDPGRLIYREGASNNLADFSKARLTYDSSGLVTMIDSTGASIEGTWHFSNADNTQVTETYGQHSVVRTIVFLTKKSYRWTDDARHTGYAEMKPE